MPDAKYNIIPRWLRESPLWLLPLLGSILAPALAWMNPSEQLKQIGELKLTSLVQALSVLILILFAWLIYLVWQLKKKPNLNNYEFVNPPGFYKHKRKKFFYICQPCFDFKKIVSPISWINASGLICRVCGDKYPLDLASLRSCPDELSALEKAELEIKSNPEYLKLLKKARG